MNEFKPRCQNIVVVIGAACTVWCSGTRAGLGLYPSVSFTELMSTADEINGDQ